MYVPATSAQPAAPAVPLIPIEIRPGGASPGVAGPAGLATLGAAPAHVSLTVRRPDLHVHRHVESSSTLSHTTISFIRCVTMRESSMEWHIVDPPYSGGDQWTESTWLAAGGGRFATIAARATPQEQMLVFARYEPSHPGAWPVTVPACS